MVDDPSTRSRPFVAAGAFFSDGADRVMLVRPTYKDGWDIPGGYVEANELPRETCMREIREELDLDVQLGQLLVADWAPSDGEGDKILFVFDGGSLTARQLTAIRLQDGEIAEYAFRDVRALDEFLVPRLVRRLTVAAGARSNGQTVYLEHGYLQTTT